MYIYYTYPHELLLLNIESNKTQKPSIIPSPDLPDSEQAAPSVRSTRGHAAKRETQITGQFVWTSVHVHVHVQHPMIALFNVGTNKTGKSSASLDLPDSQQAAPSVRSTRGRAPKRNTVLAGQYVCILCLCLHDMQILLNLDTQKKQGILESLDLPDSQLTAPSLRSSRGHPAKREVEPAGQFVYMYM